MMTVSPVSSSVASGLAGSRATIADNFETFLSLLTTQLRNQNPLDPLDTNQFTSQLVQFTSVEQQLKTNEFLEAMLMGAEMGARGQATAYIGKVVTASGVRSELTEAGANWRFHVDKAADVSITVRDADGNVAYTQTGPVTQGESEFNWDGRGSDGRARPFGTYTITIDARDADGRLVPVSTSMQGTVTGVDYSGSEPVLLMGEARVNMTGVLSVRDPSAS